MSKKITTERSGREAVGKRSESGEIMGKSSQRKGADGERELAALLREHGFDIQRGGSLSFGEIPDLTGLPWRTRSKWRGSGLGNFFQL